MAHLAQHEFFQRVKNKFPDSFENKQVLDCGSLDINGNLRDLFDDCEYVGVDIHQGPNVDIVMPIHELPFVEDADVVVSAEMFEHDEFYKKSLRKMYEALRHGGLMAISCGGFGRAIHGVGGLNWGTSPNYYRNLLEDDYHEIFDLDKEFTEWKIEYNAKDKDLYFYGVKA